MLVLAPEPSSLLLLARTDAKPKRLLDFAEAFCTDVVRPLALVSPAFEKVKVQARHTTIWPQPMDTVLI